MTTLLTTPLLITIAFAGEPDPSVLTVDIERTEVSVDLRSSLVAIQGEVLEGTCTEDGRAIPCEGGVQHVLLVDGHGAPVHAFVGRAVKWADDTVVLSGDAIQYVAPRDAARWESTLYGIWGIGGTVLDVGVFSDADGEAIWGIGGTVFDDDIDRVTPIAIWGTEGAAIWGIGGTVFEGIWGIGGTVFGADGTSVEAASVVGTSGSTLAGGATHWPEELQSTDLDVLLEEGFAEAVTESTAMQLPLAEIELETLCETFHCE